jgi:hypothetical protein
MREFFAVEGEAPRPKPPRQPRRLEPPTPPAGLTTSDASLYVDALARVHTLALERRFEEAEAQVRLILDLPDPHGCILQELGADLGNIAAAYSDHPAVCEWARKWAHNMWYAWGSGATSGGEGAARLVEIEAAVESLDRICGRDR